MFSVTPRLHFMRLFFDNRPRAYAVINGNESNPAVRGIVNFYEVENGGLLIEAEVFGLPNTGGGEMPSFYGFHIHEKGDCSGSFSNTGGHFNPEGLKHPHHEGDMIPLFSTDGYAWLAFYDTALELQSIIGRSVIIHRDADDFTTQPSGNSGEMIGCGVIRLS